jgi:hypothetical protein
VALQPPLIAMLNSIFTCFRGLLGRRDSRLPLYLFLNCAQLRFTCKRTAAFKDLD